LNGSLIQLSRGLYQLADLVMNQPVRSYNAPKTVIDCFRWHKKMGWEVAIQAAQAYLTRTDASPSDLLFIPERFTRYAENCLV
jgi:hypothetical protein